MNDKSKLMRRMRDGACIAMFATATYSSVYAQASIGTIGNVGTFGTTSSSTGGLFGGATPSNASSSLGNTGGSSTTATQASDGSGANSNLQGGGGARLDNGIDGAATNGSGDRVLNQSRPTSRSNSGSDGSSKRSDPRPEDKAVRQPNQFQQFVSQATGRLLPIYGQDLFDRPQVYVPDANAPVSDDYVLGPGDDVRVQVWGGVDYEGALTIDRNGQVSIPRAGVVTLAGVRAGDVERVLRSQLSGTFTNFNLNASVERLRSIQVYVVGQAQQPGTYNVSSLSTLVNALFASGGPSANGSMRNIQLRRGNKVVTTFDVYRFIGVGDKSRDVRLQAGDVIVIPPVGPRVAITGALDTAAIYELESGPGGNTSLGQILDLSGGVPVLATTKKALIERVVPGDNTPRQVQDLALNAAGLAQPLRDGDIITLLNISPAFANAVTLQGNVAAPLRYRWFPGMRIRDLIPEREALITADYYQRKNLLVQNTESLAGSLSAGRNVTDRVRGIVDQINWDYAAVERLDRDRVRTQLIPFNLASAISGTDDSQNLTLQPGDVVTVFSEKDLRLPVERQSRLVRVEGEVAAPGVYEALPGETMTQLLQRIGGARPQAYLFGTEFNRVSVRQKQQENLDLLIRRLEQQQRSELLFLAANRPSDTASQAALFQQQQASAQAQIAALRSLRSTGRVALELDPTAKSISALPDVPLEDGDRIMIPPVPAFISAAGAVNNENVFIFRNGRTVAEVLKSAGLREEADSNLVFVLRADGSLVSRKDRSGWFGKNFEDMELMPGDTVVVPEKLDRETTRNFVTRQLRDWSSILAQFGLTAAAFKVLRD